MWQKINLVDRQFYLYGIMHERLNYIMNVQDRTCLPCNESTATTVTMGSKCCLPGYAATCPLRSMYETNSYDHVKYVGSRGLNNYEQLILSALTIISWDTELSLELHPSISWIISTTSRWRYKSHGHMYKIVIYVLIMVSLLTYQIC